MVPYFSWKIGHPDDSNIAGGIMVYCSLCVVEAV